MSGRGVGSIICCMAGCLAVLSLPFIVCDLYYAYNDTTCVQLPIQNTSISFTMETWLKVSGYLALTMIATLFLVAILICCTEKAVVLFLGYVIITLIVSLFNIVWFIVGAVMFWGYLYPNNLCASSVQAYIFARLIFGSIGVFVNLFTTRRQQKQAEAG